MNSGSGRSAGHRRPALLAVQALMREASNREPMCFFRNPSCAVVGAFLSAVGPEKRVSHCSMVCQALSTKGPVVCLVNRRTRWVIWIKGICVTTHLRDRGGETGMTSSRSASVQQATVDTFLDCYSPLESLKGRSSTDEGIIFDDPVAEHQHLLSQGQDARLFARSVDTRCPSFTSCLKRFLTCIGPKS